MASSGTISSGRYAGAYGPWLTLAWTQVSQSIDNNTTTLDLTLRFHWDRNISYNFAGGKKGTLQGYPFTYTGSASGSSGSRILKTQRVTISHTSNGTKSVTLSGNIQNLGLNWSGTNIGTMSVSGTAHLNTIPRASSISAFSFNAHLKNGVANQINYTVDRKSTAFRHQIQLRDGSTTVRMWDNISSNGASTLTLSASEVNMLLERMGSSTTKSYTLRIATRSGSGGNWIGSAVTRNATATVHADVVPSVSGLTFSQVGNNITTDILQGFSRIKASFTRSAGYGASISSSSITIRKRSPVGDTQTINSNSGTTTNPVSLNGTYEIRGTARDSRGRTSNTAWSTFTVTPYSAPTITKFTVARNEATPTVVNIDRSTTHTVLGTSNHLTYTLQRKQGDGAWANISSGATGSITTSPASGTATSTGNDVTLSYDFRLIIQDKFGRRAESVQTITTQRVVLDIHKNEGVGIGKIHEDGVLDVDGEAHFKGDVFVNHVNLARTQSLSTVVRNLGIEVSDTIEFWQTLPQGTYYVSKDVIPSQPSSYGIMVHSTQAHGSGADFNTIWYSQATGAVYRKSGNGSTNANWLLMDRPNKGSSSNGEWIRFNDGTQICWRWHTAVYTSSERFLERFWTPPVAFVGDPVVIPIRNTYWGAWNYTTSIPSAGVTSDGRAHIRVWAQNSYPWSTSSTVDMSITMIGRWK